ncbi:MAG: site-specific integrase [Clostridia bacterium]|nr:site-specific integrase [Clostridia bacterium]
MRVCKIQQQETTLQEAMSNFLNYKKAQQVAARTMRDYEHYLSEFLKHSHNSLDEKILADDILSFFAAIPSTSPARFNHPYQNLSSFFNWAIKQDIITKNPITTQGIKKKRDDGNIKPASIEDIKKMLDSFDKTTYAGLRNYIITLVMLDTGIRTSELIRLKDNDFDFGAKQIIISKTISKTRRHRIVYLSNSTATALANFIKIKPSVWEDWLFPTREGEQMRTEGLDLEFNRQCKKIGIKFTPYQLRHTFATYFVANGGDIFTLQDLMGHSDIRMTRRYTEIDGTTKRKQHEAFSPVNALSGKSRLVKMR